ncbi:hypothetical protein AOB60_01645 [Streptomyces noursei]|uniref:Uncharacterized protein n=2 Tax=Streptomyces noursei TaxID=1971 RepID=A0A2N8PFR4_STRNR|nr:hypothetical protein AOB60_01645 [Streptomyces noursei]
MAVAGDNLYIAASGSAGSDAKIWKISTNDGVTKSLFRNGLAMTDALAAAGDTLYFTQHAPDGDSVMKILTNVSGAEPVTVKGVREKLASMAVVGDSLYIAESNSDLVANISTVSPTAFEPVVRGLNKPFGVAAADGILYISEGVENGRVMRAFITGGAPAPFIENLKSPRGLAVADGVLYIAEGGSGKVLMTPAVGDGKLSIVAEDLVFPTAVTVANGTLYIAEGQENGRVRKAPRLWKRSDQ